jgi:hypothetical protein
MSAMKAPNRSIAWSLVILPASTSFCSAWAVPMGADGNFDDGVELIQTVGHHALMHDLGRHQDGGDQRQRR